MNALQIRQDLINYINIVDERFIKMVYAMAKEYSKEEDYTLAGPPMSKKTYKERIKKAKARVKSGQYTKQEDLA